MAKSDTQSFNPTLDLILERTVDVPRALVWEAWTNPEHVIKWFAPKPWTTESCEIDLRPGGVFNVTMKSPEGEAMPGQGCFLEIVEAQKLVWTDVLVAGFRPSSGGHFTGVILLEDAGEGTKYTAIAMHKNEEDRNRHDEMGFTQGWSACLDQLVENIRSGSITPR